MNQKKAKQLRRVCKDIAPSNAKCEYSTMKRLDPETLEEVEYQVLAKTFKYPEGSRQRVYHDMKRAA